MTEKTIGPGPVEAKKVARFPKGITLLLDTFNEEGKLQKISAYFVQKGVVKFQVWRPNGPNGDYFLAYEQPGNAEDLGYGARELPVTLDTPVMKGDRVAVTADNETLAVGCAEAPDVEYPCRELPEENFAVRKLPYKFSVSATYKI